MFTSMLLGFTAASTIALLSSQRSLIREFEARIRGPAGILYREMAALPSKPSLLEEARLRSQMNILSDNKKLLWIRLPDASILGPKGYTGSEIYELALLADRAYRTRGGPKILNNSSRINTLSQGKDHFYWIADVGDSRTYYLIGLQAIAENGFELWISLDITETVNYAVSQVIWMLISWLLCLVMIFFAISYLAGRIIRPLQELRAQTSRINLDHLADWRLDIDTNTVEVDEICNAYNSLLYRLSAAWQGQHLFVSTVSHELKNSLAIISGYLQRLLKRSSADLNEEGVHSLQTADAETNRIIRLLNNLLDISRAESGIILGRNEPVAVDEVLTMVYELSGPQLSKRLKLILPNDAVENSIIGIADSDSLQQAVMNIIQNADKYSPSDSPITLILKKQLDGWVRISVKDQGMGISPQDLPRIFDRFYRGQNATQFREGSGLGLSVVKSLVEKMGGKIQVDSVLNHGTTFHLLLRQPPASHKQ